MFDRPKLASILEDEGIRTASLKKGKLYLMEKDSLFIKWGRNGPPKGDRYRHNGLLGRWGVSPGLIDSYGNHSKEDHAKDWNWRWRSMVRGYSRKPLVVEYLGPFKWDSKVKAMAMADFREHWEEAKQFWEPILEPRLMAELEILRKDPTAWPVGQRNDWKSDRFVPDTASGRAGNRGPYAKKQLLQKWAEHLGYKGHRGWEMLGPWLEENDPNWSKEYPMAPPPDPESYPEYFDDPRLEKFSLQNPAKGNKPMEAWLRKNGEKVLKDLESKLSSKLVEYEIRQSGTWVEDRVQESWDTLVKQSKKAKLGYFQVVGNEFSYGALIGDPYPLSSGFEGPFKLKGRPWMLVAEITEVRPLPWEK